MLLCAASMLGLAAPATAATATSWGFVCNADYGWVRANWPTIRPNTSVLTPVYFRARLDRYTASGWRHVATTRWYVGVSNRWGRQLLDTSLGALPYPFVGTLGHYFAYVSHHRTYAGPQLGPAFTRLPYAYYRTREQYRVKRASWSAHAHVQGTSSTSCAA